MKVKKMLTIWTVVLCSIIFFASVSGAADKWHRVRVKEVGLSEEDPTKYVIKLQKDTGSSRRYMIPSDAELNRCLAIALSAASSGMDVFAYVDWAISGTDQPIGGLKLKGN